MTRLPQVGQAARSRPSEDRPAAPRRSGPPPGEVHAESPGRTAAPARTAHPDSPDVPPVDPGVRPVGGLGVRRGLPGGTDRPTRRPRSPGPQPSGPGPDTAGPDAPAARAVPATAFRLRHPAVPP